MAQLSLAWLMDRFGARLASIAGFALFIVASCMIAVAETQTALLTGRILQGLAASISTISLVSSRLT